MDEELSRFRHGLVRDFSPTEVIGGLFPRGYTSVISSKSGVGKTWLMLKLACQLSVGGEIASGLAVEEAPRKVLIFSGETGATFLDKRFAQTQWKIEEKNISVYDLFSLSSQGVDIMLNDVAGQGTFSGIVMAEKPDIIFIDTLVSFHKGDENVQKDMAGVFGFLQSIATQCQCAIVVMHHLRKSAASIKSQRADQDEVIGSSVLARLASVIYIITRSQQATIFPLNKVTNAKTWLKAVPDWQYSIKSVGGFVDVTFDVMSIDPELTARHKLQNFVLHSWEIGTQYTVDDIVERLHLNRNLIRAYLKEYIESGVIHQISDKSSTNSPKHIYVRLDA